MKTNIIIKRNKQNIPLACSHLYRFHQQHEPPQDEFGATEFSKEPFSSSAAGGKARRTVRPYSAGASYTRIASEKPNDSKALKQRGGRDSQSSVHIGGASGHILHNPLPKQISSPPLRRKVLRKSRSAKGQCEKHSENFLEREAAERLSFELLEGLNTMEGALF